MKKIVNLVNVFALLSLLAVGGGTAVLPQMKYETVTLHHWLSAVQFTDLYSLGQLSPGPNMNMVTVIGYDVAGLTGAIIVLPQGVAFATIAGMPPEYGLYAAMVPAIVGALFGSSWHLVSGPTTAISIVVFGAISPLAEPGSAHYISLV